MPHPPKPAGTVASGEQGTSPETEGGVSGPGGKNEATGDNIRKDGTDADNADGKSAQLDSTAQPDRSGPNGGPSGHWETPAGL